MLVKAAILYSSLSSVAAGDIARVRAAEPNRAIDHRLANGVQVERRPRDRLDDVVNRSLALLG